ncbi:MAG: hypothetical protein Q4D45_11860 [Lachnospiraceae bacterium]|nr:hypothetical protein [Lachnospiraceae bacterium]
MDNKRSYKFYNYITKETYMVTKEEQEVLNKYYRRERYMEEEQAYKTNTRNFSWFSFNEDEERNIGDFLYDETKNVEKEVIINELIQELLLLLDEREKEVVVKNILEGYTISVLEKSMKLSRRQIARYKRRALDKMSLYLRKRGFFSVSDVMGDFEKEIMSI